MRPVKISETISYLGIQIKINYIKKVVISENSQNKMTTLWIRNRFLGVEIWRLVLACWHAGWLARSAVFSIFRYISCFSGQSSPLSVRLRG